MIVVCVYGANTCSHHSTISCLGSLSRKPNHYHFVYSVKQHPVGEAKENLMDDETREIRRKIRRI